MAKLIRMGAEMIKVCEALETHGILDTQDLLPFLKKADEESLRRILRNLVALGLITWVGGAGRRASPRRYKVNPDWWAILDRKRAERLAQKKGVSCDEAHSHTPAHA